MPAATLSGYYKQPKSQEEHRRSVTPSDSGASSADPEDDSSRSASAMSFLRPTSSPLSDKDYFSSSSHKNKETVKRKLPSHPTIHITSSPFGSGPSMNSFSARSAPFIPALRALPAGSLTSWPLRTGGDLLLCSPALAGVAMDQDQPIDLSIKSSAMTCRASINDDCSDSEPELSIDLKDDMDAHDLKTPLDLTLVSKRSEELTG